MIRDIVRAALVLFVLAVGCEILAAHRSRPAPPTVVTGVWPQPAYGAPPPYMVTGEPPVETVGPIRRVAREFVDLAEAVIGVMR
jgi:hypothetical protein